MAGPAGAASCAEVRSKVRPRCDQRRLGFGRSSEQALSDDVVPPAQLSKELVFNDFSYLFLKNLSSANEASPRAQIRNENQKSSDTSE